MLATLIALTMAGLQLPFAELVTLPIDFSKSELIAIATSSAAKYNLTKRQTNRMLKTIECESNWDENAVSPTLDYGVIQMNRRSHPEFSIEQMFDPYFALDWMAEQFSLKHYSLWVCYSLLYAS